MAISPFAALWAVWGMVDSAALPFFLVIARAFMPVAIRSPFCRTLFGVGDGGFDLHFCPKGKNYCSHQFLNWWQQHAAGMLHLRWVRIHIQAEKRHTKRCVSFLVGDGGFEPPKA